MTYSNRAEVEEYIASEIDKAVTLLEKHPGKGLILQGSLIPDIIEDLQQQIQVEHIVPSLTRDAEENFIKSQAILYGGEYIKSYTFYTEFMLIESCGSWRGWKEGYYATLRDFESPYIKEFFEGLTFEG